MKIEVPAHPSRRQMLALIGGVGGLGVLALAGGGDNASVECRSPSSSPWWT